MIVDDYDTLKIDKVTVKRSQILIQCKNKMLFESTGRITLIKSSLNKKLVKKSCCDCACLRGKKVA